MKKSLILIFILTVLSLGCRPQDKDTRSEPQKAMKLKPCLRSDYPALVSVDALCGKLEVLENPKARDGRKISINIVVVPALAVKPKVDPLFFLAGGPGQSATGIAPMMLHFFKQIRAHRDLVFVDQRGTGQSNPLECDWRDDPDDPAELFREEPPEGELEKCVRGYEADLRFYTTDIAMDDLDDVRKALGYEQINLYGGSYGTRAALVYMRRHGEHVRTAVLDGVAPLDIMLPYHFHQDAGRAMKLLLESCASEEKCSRAFPGLDKDFDDLLSGLEKSPVHTTIKHARTGKKVDVEVTKDSVAGIVFGSLYSSEMSALIPLAIKKALAGDFQMLSAMASLTVGSAEIAMGMYMAVACNEDIRRLSEADDSKIEMGTFLTKKTVDLARKQCRLFDDAKLSESYFEPVNSSVPTLILSGRLDPVTPPRWGENVAKHLTNSKHVVIPGVGHGTVVRGCVPKKMAEFIDKANALEMDFECVKRMQRYPFFISNTGPVSWSKND